MGFDRSEAYLRYPQINPVVLLFLPDHEAQYQVEHIEDDCSKRVVTVQFVCLFIGIISVALRFISRRIVKVKYKIDDWLALSALIFLIVFSALIFLEIWQYGAGRHAILLKEPIKFAQTAIAAELIYGCSITSIKISMVLLLGRIFPSRTLHRFLWFIGILVFLYWLPITIVTIFQCRPVRAAWTFDSERKCIDVKKVWMACTALHAATDIALIIAPMPFVWRLQIRLSTKIPLMCLFCVGGFVTVVSIYRIPVLQQISFYDGSYTDEGPVIWSAVETSTAIFCASAITYRPLLTFLPGNRRPIPAVRTTPSFINSPRYGHTTWAKLWQGRSLTNITGGTPRRGSGPGIVFNKRNKRSKSVPLSPKSGYSDEESWTKGSTRSDVPFSSKFSKSAPQLHRFMSSPSIFSVVTRKKDQSLPTNRFSFSTPPPPPPAWTKPNYNPSRNTSVSPLSWDDQSVPPTFQARPQEIAHHPNWQSDFGSDEKPNVSCPRDFYETRSLHPPKR